ncbi:MAG: SDR family NAD(P)-dependent oxidoreductase [Candidatus Promineifilaceae bacterium]|nr:SDR family NAD(P)-dependent oxidoreductase [Candidatus Promineifilaceae bacterium]
MTDALIWGASGGMGRALVQMLAHSGWRVFAAARDTARIPDSAYRRYHFEAVDQALLRDVALDLAHESSGLDLWIYAAGGLRAEQLHRMAPPSWNDVLDSNLNGAFMTATQTVHLVREGGSIFFIGAYVDHLILPKMGAYAAAKAGLEALVEVLQKEQRHLNVSLVRPGAVDTPFWQNVPFHLPAAAKQPEAVAQAILEHHRKGGRGALDL